MGTLGQECHNPSETGDEQEKLDGSERGFLMKYYSNRLNRLVTQLSMLPGIGQKTAERLAYHIVKLPKERSEALVDAIRDASGNVSCCKMCFARLMRTTCPVCSSQNRNLGSLWSWRMMTIWPRWKERRV